MRHLQKLGIARQGNSHKWLLGKFFPSFPLLFLPLALLLGKLGNGAIHPTGSNLRPRATCNLFRPVLQGAFSLHHGLVSSKALVFDMWHTCSLGEERHGTLSRATLLGLVIAGPPKRPQADEQVGNQDMTGR
jgi:hypothetical protein